MSSRFPPDRVAQIFPNVVHASGPLISSSLSAIPRVAQIFPSSAHASEPLISSSLSITRSEPSISPLDATANFSNLAGALSVSSSCNVLQRTIMFKQDSDVVRWGLDSLFDYHPSHNSVYSRTTTPCENFCYDAYYVREDNVGPDHSTVENDEDIAHALQEELSQLAVAEASGSSSTTDEQSHASILVQDLMVSSGRGYNHGDGDHHEEGNNMEPSTSGSSPEENYEGNEWPSELTNDYFDLDGEVGKKLSKMVPIPHVPKINGAILSVDEATSDHERLLERLRLYDLLEVKVQGDGNCQFRALSDQLYRTTRHHRFVRQQIVNQLESHHNIYEGYVPMAYADYLKKLSRDGEWGDHVTLQAAADLYGVKIFVITSFKDTCSIEILPTVEKSKRVILLSFWAEVHYNSIYPEGELPISNIKKNKRDFFLDQLPSSCTVM